MSSLLDRAKKTLQQLHLIDTDAENLIGYIQIHPRLTSTPKINNLSKLSDHSGDNAQLLDAEGMLFADAANIASKYGVSKDAIIESFNIPGSDEGMDYSEPPTGVNKATWQRGQLISAHHKMDFETQLWDKLLHEKNPKIQQQAKEILSSYKGSKDPDRFQDMRAELNELAEKTYGIDIAAVEKNIDKDINKTINKNNTKIKIT